MGLGSLLRNIWRQNTKVWQSIVLPVHQSTYFCSRLRLFLLGLTVGLFDLMHLVLDIG